MTKITISNQSFKSYRKYKLENGRTRTSEYIRGDIGCHGGVSNDFNVFSLLTYEYSRSDVDYQMLASVVYTIIRPFLLP
jgi:hypothetical protein